MVEVCSHRQFGKQKSIICPTYHLIRDSTENGRLLIQGPMFSESKCRLTQEKERDKDMCPNSTSTKTSVPPVEGKRMEE